MTIKQEYPYIWTWLIVIFSNNRAENVKHQSSCQFHWLVHLVAAVITEVNSHGAGGPWQYLLFRVRIRSWAPERERLFDRRRSKILRVWLLQFCADCKPYTLKSSYSAASLAVIPFITSGQAGPSQGKSKAGGWQGPSWFQEGIIFRPLVIIQNAKL